MKGLTEFVNEFKQKVSAASPSQTADKQPVAGAAIPSATEPAVDENGYAIEAVGQTGEAGPCAVPEEDGEYQGIGNANGVIIGESRSRQN